mmetsp:Transcript_23872/g.75162  ORF Transcript_23872/g.75162 Transcript_23872/m.75162 type:complete len:712 (-) Transcript_23872:2695-4830(-)
MRGMPLLALLLLAAAAGPAGVAAVTSLPYAELAPLSGDVLERLRAALTGDGLVAVTGVPGLGDAKRAAFAAAAKAAAAGGGHGFAAPQDMRLPDGALRQAFHAAGGRGTPSGREAFGDGASGAPAVEAFRMLVDGASDALLSALDAAFGLGEDVSMGGSISGEGASDPSPAASPLLRAVPMVGGVRGVYHTDAAWGGFRDVGAGDSSEQLEHFHIYSGGSAGEEYALDLHTDAGFFVMFSPGMYWHGGENHVEVCEPNAPGTDFEYLDATGATRDLGGLAPNTLLLMVGDGAVNWLNPALPKDLQLRATPHALRVRGGCDLRTWYGRMFLPHREAWLPGQGVTFGSLKEQAAQKILALQQQPGGADGVLLSAAESSVGCDLGLGRALSADQAAACSQDEFYCWMTCQTAADWDLDPQCSVENMQCLNNDTDEPQSGDAHNGHATCRETPVKPVASSDNGFCRGSGVVMYMDGFQSFLFYDGEKPMCPNFLYKEWTLDSAAKFVLGCLGAVLMGFLTELLTFSRRKIRGGSWRWDLALDPLLDVVRCNKDRVVNLSLACLYGLQVTIAYFDMLIAMSYCSELFGALVVGLILGHFCFNVENSVGETVDPCCVRVAMEGQRTYGGYLPLDSDAPDVRARAVHHLVVKGMTCGSCEATVKRAIMSVSGVKTADVSCQTASARVEISESTARTDEDILQSCAAMVSEAGFEVEQN